MKPNETLVNALVLNKIMHHLSIACHDKRERERRRAKIALKHIKRFTNEVLKELWWYRW